MVRDYSCIILLWITHEIIDFMLIEIKKSGSIYVICSHRCCELREFFSLLSYTSLILIEFSRMQMLRWISTT